MIEIDASALQQAEKMLQGIPGAAKKAVSTAARKTVRGAKKDAVQKVRERYTIKATYTPEQCPSAMKVVACPLASSLKGGLMTWHI